MSFDWAAFFEYLPRLIQAAVDIDLAGSSDLSRVLSHVLVASPSFNLRGGTPEVLRGIIAKGLGLR
jgi:hypothetical protein